jgi:hypothetical protein
MRIYYVTEWQFVDYTWNSAGSCTLGFKNLVLRQRSLEFSGGPSPAAIHLPDISQWQSINHKAKHSVVSDSLINLYLFSDGLLYVTLSHVTNHANLQIIVPNTRPALLGGPIPTQKKPRPRDGKKQFFTKKRFFWTCTKLFISKKLGFTIQKAL